MIRKLFGGQINSITIAALLVALSSLVSRFLGVFRDRILAGEFGAGDTLDIYYAAFRIPDLIFNLLVLGALSAGFIPIFISLLDDPIDRLRSVLTGERDKSAWFFANNVLNILGVALIALSILGVVFAPYFMKLITPGFSEEKMSSVVYLARIMFLSPIFLGVSSVLGGVLQSFKRFFVYSLAPIVYNIGIILGALYFVPVWGVVGLAYGVVLGAFFHMIVQMPLVRKLGFKYKPVFNFKNENIKKAGKMMTARTMSLAIVQINLLVITIIASTLESGSLAIFNFANNLQSFPIGIFGVSFAVAAFPALSAIAFDRKKLVEMFSSTLRQILFFIVPSTVLLLTLRAQIIRVILGTGQFDWNDTVLTIHTLGFFSISLFAQATLPLLSRVFYARHDSKTPFYIGLVSIIINVVLSYKFSKTMGVDGLALAFSIANIINFIILWIVLHLEIGNIDETKILFSVIKFSVAALACGATVQGMKLVVWPFIDMTKTMGVFTQGFIAGMSGLIIYLLVSALLKSEEFFSFWNSIKRRLSWRRVEAGDQGEARGI